MSHEVVYPGGKLVYTMPAWPSDVLRCREFDQFFKSHHGIPFCVQSRDGWRWFSSTTQAPAFTATFSSREQLDAVIGDSTEDSLAKAFLEGDLTIQGDTFALLSVAEYVLRHSKGFSPSLVRTLSGVMVGWLKKLRNNGRLSMDSPQRGWRANFCPSDLSVNFFEPWLGASLGHSCAHFRSFEESLESAQRHTFEKVCGMLALSRQDRLLDLSCGWGSLLLYAAERCNARAQGISYCEQQVAVAMERIRQHHLQGMCDAACWSSAGTASHAHSFDKIVDISLFQQVAHSHFKEFLMHACEMLAPGGLLLLHRVTGATRPPRYSILSWHGEGPMLSEAPSLSSELQMAEAAGLHVVEVEDLGRDYRRTLRLWIEQLQRSATAMQDTHYRTWLFHLLDTATNLDAGNVQLHQMLLSRPPDAETAEIAEAEMEWRYAS